MKIVILSSLIGFFGVLNAEVQGTLVGRFDMQICQVQGLKSRVFVNNSNRDLVIRWKLVDKQTLNQYKQEPVVKKGQSIQIDLDGAVKGLMAGSKELSNYEFSLEILRVKQLPTAPGIELKMVPLKEGEYALLIGKTKFLKHQKFTLTRNKNGLLVCQVGAL